jgi:hypothetical protein
MHERKHCFASRGTWPLLQYLLHLGMITPDGQEWILSRMEPSTFQHFKAGWMLKPFLELIQGGQHGRDNKRETPLGHGVLTASPIRAPGWIWRDEVIRTNKSGDHMAGKLPSCSKFGCILMDGDGWGACLTVWDALAAVSASVLLQSWPDPGSQTSVSFSGASSQVLFRSETLGRERCLCAVTCLTGADAGTTHRNAAAGPRRWNSKG